MEILFIVRIGIFVDDCTATVSAITLPAIPECDGTHIILPIQYTFLFGLMSPGYLELFYSLEKYFWVRKKS